MDHGTRLHIGAFTLLEVLVMLGVIGALAVGVSLSMHTASHGADLRRASEDLAVFFSSAQASSAVANMPMLVVIEPRQSVVVLQRIGGEPFELAHRLSAGVVIDGVLHDGAMGYDQALRLVIQPSGYVSHFGLRLARGERKLWVLWDPAADIGWSTLEPSEVMW